MKISIRFKGPPSSLKLKGSKNMEEGEEFFLTKHLYVGILLHGLKKLSYILGHLCICVE